MIKVGAILMLLGVGALTAYGFYAIVLVLYIEPHVPFVFKLALPAVLLGVVLLIAVIFRDRLRARKQEQFEEVEH